MLSDLLLRFRALFRRRVVETELKGELRFHFESEVEKYKGRGRASKEALRLARLSFRGHEQIKEDCREARGTNLLESCLHDIRYGLRSIPDFEADGTVPVWSSGHGPHHVCCRRLAPASRCKPGLLLACAKSNECEPRHRAALRMILIKVAACLASLSGVNYVLQTKRRVPSGCDLL
jgi:hypothetical protein